MIDLDLIKNPRGYYAKQKKGYSLNEKKEFSIVRETLIRYGLPVKLFDKNLESLVIDEGKEQKKSIGYNDTKNMIFGVTSGFDLVHELFHMASKGEDSFGSIMKIKGKNIGQSINEGITDYLTYLSSDNKYEIMYPIEVFVAQYLIQYYGREFLDYHFSSDTNNIYKLFGEDREEIISMLQSLDKFTMHKTEVIDNMNMDNIENLNNMVEVMFNDLILSISKLLNIISKSSIDEMNKCFENFKRIFKRKSKANGFFNIISISSYRNFDTLFDEISKNLEEGFGRK